MFSIQGQNASSSSSLAIFIVGSSGGNALSLTQLPGFSKVQKAELLHSSSYLSFNYSCKRANYDSRIKRAEKSKGYDSAPGTPQTELEIVHHSIQLNVSQNASRFTIISADAGGTALQRAQN